MKIFFTNSIVAILTVGFFAVSVLIPLERLEAGNQQNFTQEVITTEK
jgi:hypothetical protein